MVSDTCLCACVDLRTLHPLLPLPPLLTTDYVSLLYCASASIWRTMADFLMKHMAAWPVRSHLQEYQHTRNVNTIAAQSKRTILAMAVHRQLSICAHSCCRHQGAAKHHARIAAAACIQQADCGDRYRENPLQHMTTSSQKVRG
jgi:hypothetical protein